MIHYLQQKVVCSINSLFRDLLQEKRGFKYNLLAITTLKRWNNATNTYDIQTIYLRSEAITVINQRVNLHLLDFWAGEGSE